MRVASEALAHQYDNELPRTLRRLHANRHLEEPQRRAVQIPSRLMRAADTVSPLVRCQIYRPAMGLDEIIEFAKANVAAIAVVIGTAIVLVALAERMMGARSACAWPLARRQKTNCVSATSSD
jgi:hypothetical protein